jgi:hypothetical protein
VRSQTCRRPVDAKITLSDDPRERIAAGPSLVARPRATCQHPARSRDRSHAAVDQAQNGRALHRNLRATLWAKQRHHRASCHTRRGPTASFFSRACSAHSGSHAAIDGSPANLKTRLARRHSIKKIGWLSRPVLDFTAPQGHNIGANTLPLIVNPSKSEAAQRKIARSHLSRQRLTKTRFMAQH